MKELDDLLAEFPTIKRANSGTDVNAWYWGIDELPYAYGPNRITVQSNQVFLMTGNGGKLVAIIDDKDIRDVIVKRLMEYTSKPNFKFLYVQQNSGTFAGTKLSKVKESLAEIRNEIIDSGSLSGRCDLD